MPPVKTTTATKVPPPRDAKPKPTDDDEEVPSREPFYCPGCGRQYGYMTECNGMSATAPHPPIEVVSTDELDGDPEKHTAAPNTGQ